MAKRFTDSDKWKKQFLREMRAAYKLLWFYILDDCDYAGIWEVDFDVAVLKIGENVTELNAIKAFGNRIQILDGGRKWFIRDFIDFQYGEPDPNNRMHKSVIGRLKRYGLYPFMEVQSESLNPLISPFQGAKEQEQIQEQVMEQEKEQDSQKDVMLQKVAWFEELWKKYPNKIGKTKAWDKFRKSVNAVCDYEAIGDALRRYLTHLEAHPWKEKQDGKTWFGNWKEWSGFEENKEALPEKEKYADLERRLSKK